MSREKKYKNYDFTKYPPDGGLKEPVREFGEGFNIFDMIKKHFKK